MDVPAFLRLFQLRASQIMWFLGAGASRAAGIKTAGDMIWDFKQRLYRSQKKLPPSAITDIGEPSVQRKLQVISTLWEPFRPSAPRPSIQCTSKLRTTPQKIGALTLTN
jgi:hypothetical protein